MDPSFSSFVLAFSAGAVAFLLASVALAAAFVQGRFETSRLLPPTVGIVACGLLSGFLVIVASSGGVPWGLAALPGAFAVALSAVGIVLARGMPPLPGYGRVDLWLLGLCLAGSLLLAGLVGALHVRAAG